MRVQHNITAMNSYRNFTTNNSSLSKNLEKLSSGYAINRAGDNAAGLAISEKMRAQITGLDVAQKNANDGISLVQTAEGALTEVHSMLNRMYELAEQSANGTYESSVDRAQLQKEVDALKTEINRIADSANFNGIQLLDGSLSTQGVDANLSANVSATATTATKNIFTTSVAWTVSTEAPAADKKLTMSVAWKEADGTERSNEVSLTLKKGSDLGDDYTANDFYLVGKDGEVYDDVHGTTAGAITVKAVQDAVINELNKDEDFKAAFDVAINSTTAGKFDFTSTGEGSKGATITGIDVTTADAEVLASAADGFSARQTGIDASQKLDLTKVGILAGTAASASTYTESILSKATFEVDGNKFVMVGTGATAAGLKNLREALGEDVNIIQLSGTYAGNDDGTTVKYDPATATASNAGIVAAELTRVTGKEFTVASAAHPDGDFAANDILYSGETTLTNVSTLKENKLTLQIGDTSDSFNQMNVEIADMHTTSLGIKDENGKLTSTLADVDIGTQEGAAAACDVLKAAINQVSDTRGGLGAIQNRLEHTIQNLSVMQENLQNAESVIRDTDVADEMMEYTKNSILNQSAQAMLAQANQLPQGVLQLLQ